jgi:hydroxymethylpyrimidine/phosphomethylpyrimidine kinase
VVLAIVGHDPIGGAGEAAVLRTFAALGVHGASALTLVSAQNTTELRQVQPMAPAMVAAQVEAVLDDLDVAAVTVGMLWDAGIATAVADLARSGRLPNLVVDPVLASARGVRIVEVGVDRIYRDVLFGCARIVTPNTVEAGLLVGGEVDSVDEAADAGRSLLGWGPEAVVVTGGRRPGAEAVDVMVTGRGTQLLSSAWVDTPNVRGSGDTFAAATTARLAHGDTVEAAVRVAHAFTVDALRRAAPWSLGAGQGPLDQLGLTDRP